ncbi:MAG TPA: hypothetical protein VFL79_00320 [Terriglobia bacterium]|nr:hypothetical protein [Terriglobia bacterium]
MAITPGKSGKLVVVQVGPKKPEWQTRNESAHYLTNHFRPPRLIAARPVISTLRAEQLKDLLTRQATGLRAFGAILQGS